MNTPDIQAIGASDAEVVTMRAIFLTVCANLQIAPEDTEHRQAIVTALSNTFNNGNHDVDSLKAAATIAAKSAATCIAGRTIIG